MSEFSIVGDYAAKFLDYAFFTEVSKLNPGKAKYSILCNEDGKSIDDVIIYRLAEVDYLVIANAANRAAVAKALNDRASGFEVKVIDNSDETALVALQGPKSAAILQKVTNIQIEPLKYYSIASAEVAGLTALIARTGYTGEDGFEVMLPVEETVALWRALNAAGVGSCGLGARDTLRLEAGMNLYGNDMDETRHPLESGLAWTVAFDPPERDFVGRSALEAVRAAGTSPKLVGLLLEERGVLRSHQKVIVPGLGEGEVTSGTFSPTLERSIAFARVPRATGEQVQVDIRGKLLPARVVKLPFVRHGRVLIIL
jgi:aminomethyltransferase